MQKIKKVSVRELQHNLADYLKLAASLPLLVTKHNQGQVVMINPDMYTIAKRKSDTQPNQDLMSSPFIGLHKSRKDWNDQTSAKIATRLRKKAWYGS
jgi:PHD/YefM family antitoxin component YafN of YafNO toxin-antitoxin module